MRELDGHDDIIPGMLLDDEGPAYAAGMAQRLAVMPSRLVVLGNIRVEGAR